MMSHVDALMLQCCIVLVSYYTMFLGLDMLSVCSLICDVYSFDVSFHFLMCVVRNFLDFNIKPSQLRV